jgi:hypothetical protein
MALLTVEGVVENGRVRITGSITLPENTKVYVVVPDAPLAQPAHVRSPRLADPEQATKFAKRVIEIPPDGGPH